MAYTPSAFFVAIQRKSYYPWIVWGLCAGFFFAEYLVRLEPSITKQQLMQAFHLNATSFGTLSAFFTISYVLMQIPVGMLIDKYGSHRLMVINSLACAVGCFIFAFSRDLYTAEFGRLLSGVGSAFAFVGTLRLARNWFPPSQIGLIAGMTQAAGMLGATVGEGPFAVIVHTIGWRETMWLIGAIILLISVMIALIVRDKPSQLTTAEDQSERPGLLYCLYTVLRNPQTWYNGVFVGLLYAPTAAFAELWGVPFIAETYHVATPIAATGISAIFLGWAIGGPITGWISDRQKKRKPTMKLSAILSMIMLGAILYIPHLPLFALFALLFLYGIANTGVATSYAMASEINAIEVSGTSIAFANMASVIIGSCFQPLIGVILDRLWDGTLSHGVPVYSLLAYQQAMQLLPACLFLAFLTTFLIKETHCKAQKGP